MAWLAGDDTPATAIGIGNDDFAQSGIGPANIRHFPAIAAECGKKFQGFAVVGQPPCAAPSRAFDVQLAQGFKNNPAAIGR